MSTDDQLPSLKPYLVRAIHEWCSDNGYTPYLAVAVDAYTRVPREYVKDGQIVLNLGLEATHQLAMGNELITFSARFNGVAQNLSVPVDNVAAIYARENGQGMAFEPVVRENEPELVVDTADAAGSVASEVDSASEPASARPAATPGKSHLTRIK
jgi:stringent starvation protein B